MNKVLASFMHWTDSCRKGDVEERRPNLVRCGQGRCFRLDWSRLEGVAGSAFIEVISNIINDNVLIIPYIDCHILACWSDARSWNFLMLRR